jgi:hypothetical protein
MNDTYRAADCFLHCLGEFVRDPDADPMATRAKREKALASEAIALNEALKKAILESAGNPRSLPRHIRNSLATLEQLLHTWIERQGWNELLGKDGSAYLEKKWKQYYLDVELSFYRVLVDWCAGEDAKPDPEASEKAHWAETKLGLCPTRTLSDDEGRRLALEANDRRWNASMLGSGRQSFTPEEFDAFQLAHRNIADFVGRANAEARDEMILAPSKVETPVWETADNACLALRRHREATEDAQAEADFLLALKRLEEVLTKDGEDIAENGRTVGTPGFEVSSSLVRLVKAMQVKDVLAYSDALGALRVALNEISESERTAEAIRAAQAPSPNSTSGSPGATERERGPDAPLAQPAPEPRFPAETTPPEVPCGQGERNGSSTLSAHLGRLNQGGDQSIPPPCTECPSLEDWTRQLRDILSRLHRQATGYDPALPDDDAGIAKVLIFTTLTELKEALDTPAPPLPGDVMTAYLRAQNLVRPLHKDRDGAYTNTPDVGAAIERLIKPDGAQSIEKLIGLLPSLSSGPSNNPSATPSDSVGPTVGEQSTATPSKEAKTRENLTPPSIPTPQINYETIYAALVNANKLRPARLVKFMADRVTASHAEVLNGVYEGSERAWETIKSLVNRTNNALLDLRGSEQATARRLKFKAADLTVVKIVKSER